uniref:Cilia- and flagella-associated protein 45 n=1 Tax=Hemiselmis andersenii TaxID=464988 RepID=A0A6U4MPD9_HEMAN|mmetsp:Transcript_21365/g.49543  ORF Transcript_21365/g.49543 Transcript_21365/m.49543 type:complete len:508 (-) Transcript_21365:1639-3162(-)
MSRVPTPGSVASKKSNASKNYKKVAAGATVDEGLFAAGTKVATAVKKDDLNTMLAKKPAHVETDSVVLTGGELSRLRNLATLVDRSELERQRQEQEQEKAAAQAKARERKEKMIAMEAQRKANLAKSDLELEDETKMANQLENAERARDEQLDHVKHMNQMMLYAKCVTIRDAQLLEKQMIQKERADQEKAYDLMMEQERIKAIKLAEEREAVKAQERLRGAAIIRMQIEQREKERIREQEQLDMEREAMLRQIDRLKVEETEKEEERKVAGRLLLEEAALANQEQIRRKDDIRRKLGEEEQRIADYIKEKDRKEQERQEAIDAEVKRKAEETARLRALQEKAADKQAEADALRAKRAQEDYERSYRARERAEVEKKQRMMADIMQSRVDQKRSKEVVQAEAAQMEKQQFERILAVQRAAEESEQAKEYAAHQRRINHNEEIRLQISENDEKRSRARQEFLEEGSKIRHAKELETRRLETIKQRKLAELQRAGVPEKYLAELQNKKI